jgi:hypothetical protein
MGAVRVAGVREVASGVEAFGFAAATEEAGVMEAGEVVGAVVVITRSISVLSCSHIIQRSVTTPLM